MNSIILTVHNKEASIVRILKGIFENTSDQTTSLIIVVDGCTDGTVSQINIALQQKPSHMNVRFVYAEDIWETKANNLGLKVATTPFVTIIQDDMLVLEKGWDLKLKNVLDDSSLFAASGRASLDFSLEGGEFKPINLGGREFPLGSNSRIGRIAGRIMAKFKPYFLYKFFSPISVALTVNRGPLMIKRNYLSELNYFDEQFAPFELDDVDLCCRAFKQFKLFSASCPIYYKELSGSKQSSSFSQGVSQTSIRKNTSLLIARHSDLSGFGYKHFHEIVKN